MSTKLGWVCPACHSGKREVNTKCGDCGRDAPMVVVGGEADHQLEKRVAAVREYCIAKMMGHGGAGSKAAREILALLDGDGKEAGR
jgi:hypothetical protein